MIIIINIKTAHVRKKFIKLSVLSESVPTRIHFGLSLSLWVCGQTGCHSQSLAILLFQTQSDICLKKSDEPFFGLVLSFRAAFSLCTAPRTWKAVQKIICLPFTVGLGVFLVMCHGPQRIVKGSQRNSHSARRSLRNT